MMWVWHGCCFELGIDRLVVLVRARVGFQFLVFAKTKRLHEKNRRNYLSVSLEPTFSFAGILFAICRDERLLYKQCEPPLSTARNFEF